MLIKWPARHVPRDAEYFPDVFRGRAGGGGCDTVSCYIRPFAAPRESGPLRPEISRRHSSGECIRRIAYTIRAAPRAANRAPPDDRLPLPRREPGGVATCANVNIVSFGHWGLRWKSWTKRGPEEWSGKDKLDFLLRTLKRIAVRIPLETCSPGWNESHLFSLIGPKPPPCGFFPYRPPRTPLG